MNLPIDPNADRAAEAAFNEPVGKNPPLVGACAEPLAIWALTIEQKRNIKRQEPINYFVVSAMFLQARLERDKGSVMLTIAISILLGLIAFAALLQIGVAVSQGANRARLIMVELSSSRQVKPRSPARRPVVARYATA